jgi:hypothetical protein
MGVKEERIRIVRGSGAPLSPRLGVPTSYEPNREKRNEVLETCLDAEHFCPHLDFIIAIYRFARPFSSQAHLIIVYEEPFTALVVVDKLSAS